MSIQFLTLQPYTLHISDITTLHHTVRSIGLSNYLGCRIPVPTQLDISAWRHYLQDYYDSQLLDLLEFGIPLDFDRSMSLQSTEVNHASSLQFPSHIEITYTRKFHLEPFMAIWILNHSKCMCHLL